MPVVVINGKGTDRSVGHTDSVVSLLSGILLPNGVGEPESNSGVVEVDGLWPASGKGGGGQLGCVICGLGLDGLGNVLVEVALGSVPVALDLLHAGCEACGWTSPGLLKELSRVYLAALGSHAGGDALAWVEPGMGHRRFVEALTDMVGGDVGADGERHVGEYRRLDTLLNEGVRRVEAAAAWSLQRGVAGVFREQRADEVDGLMGGLSAYLLGRGDDRVPGPSVRGAVKTVCGAWARRTDQNPLIVIGQGVGAVVAYDVLQHFMPRVEPSCWVDVLITVGSASGSFHCLSVDAAADGGVVARPGCVDRWVHVTDEAGAVRVLGESGPGVAADHLVVAPGHEQVAWSMSSWLLRPSVYWAVRQKLDAFGGVAGRKVGTGLCAGALAGA